MIDKAKIADLDDIVSIVEASKAIMNADGNVQWNDSYPLRDDFEADIADGVLYVHRIDGVVTGLICINNDEPEVYATANWRAPKPSLIIHRMAVSPDYRGQGIALKLLDFAENLARSQNVASLRTDTFSGNKPMNALFLRHGFALTGVVELPFKIQQPFHCYEKVIR